MSLKQSDKGDRKRRKKIHWFKLTEDVSEQLQTIIKTIFKDEA